MRVCDFVERLDALYPRELSCSWDNDGLMCSADPGKEIRRVLVTLDATKAAIREAERLGCDLIMAHHPMIFKGARAITPDTLVGGRTIEALRSGISVISLHTRLDAGVGGVNDCLASAIGLTDLSSFGDRESPTLGRIGNVPTDSQISVESFSETVKQALHLPYLLTAGAFPVRRVAVCGGEGSSVLEAAKAVGADTFVTGEMSYNRMEDAAEMGMNILLGGHYMTEVPVCGRLAELARTIAAAETFFYESNPALIR